MRDFTRSYPLEDIQIRSGGDGRTVEAYAAVFGVETPISDKDGQYLERIDPTAFNRTVAHRGTNFGVFYNHGMTIHGTPSERGSMPIGVPIEPPRADSKGLFTVTRYNRTALAEEALEGITSGALRAQSFSGKFLRSDLARPNGGYRADRSGNLPLVTRMEINMREYGPTPLPYYEGAAIVGVRALNLTDSDQMLLQLILSNLAEGDAALDPIVDALTTTDQALDQAQMVIAQILGVPNPDEPDDDEDMAAMGPDRSAYLSRLNALATRLQAAPAGTATRLSRLGAGDPGSAHSGRLSLSKRTREILAALH